MLRNLLDSFKRGIEKIRWFSSLFSERLRIEMAIFKLLFRSDETARERDLLLRKIGERVLELKDQPEKNILRDHVVVEAITGIVVLEKTLEDINQKVSEIGRVTGP
jgi:hypothetical protein